VENRIANVQTQIIVISASILRGKDYPDLSLKSVHLRERMLKRFEVFIITKDHSVYDYDLILKNLFLVIDKCDAVKKKNKNAIKA